MNALSITNCRVFDGWSSALASTTIHLEDGIIASLGGPVPPQADVLDAAGHVVMPGFIDAHFHAFGIDEDMLTVEYAHPSYLALSAASRLTKALLRGFTTVRDPAGGDGGIARALADGVFIGPRYLWTGAALSQTGGHGDGRFADSDLPLPRRAVMCEVVDGVEQVRAAVRDRIRVGAHAIKVMASGGVMSAAPEAVEYSAAELRAISEEAAHGGIYVTAHAYSVAAIRHAVSNGVSCIEHGNLLDFETAQIMHDAGASLVPTLAVYDATARRGAEVGVSDEVMARCAAYAERGQEAVRIAREAGVRVGFGTDLLGILEDEQLDGIRLQVEADGVLNALRSLTSVNADILGRPDLGRIAVGAAADLIVLGGDPFEDPGCLWEGGDRLVVRGGRPLET